MSLSKHHDVLAHNQHIVLCSYIQGLLDVRVWVYAKLCLGNVLILE